MLRRFAGRLTYANVMSTLGVFIALGGTAYAVNTVSSGDIVDGQVKTPDLANAAVTTAKLADNSVTTNKVLDGTLQGRDVLDNSLKGADIDESTLGKVPAAASADTATGLNAPEAWHAVAPGSTTVDLCADSTVTATFCTYYDLDYYPWQNYGFPFATAAFYKDRTGIVRFKGLVRSDYSSSSSSTKIRPIFRLPSGYRPGTERLFTTNGRDDYQEVVVGAIIVEANGMVSLVSDCDSTNRNCSANGGYVSLDGIDFRPDG